MIVLLLTVNFVTVGMAFNGGMVLKDLGEKEYLLIKAKSTLPQHGDCWRNSLSEIKADCEKLNDREHSLLALKLANCFLEDSGHVTYNCHLSEMESERRFQIDRTFLDINVSAWDLNESYQISSQLVKKITVVNDVEEKGIKLITDYKNRLTYDEDQKEFVPQVVAEY